MVSINHFEPQSLTDDESHRLVEIVRDTAGDALSRSDFFEVMLGLFEDIPGFETMLPARAHHIVHELWDIYHEQEDRKA